MSREFENRVFDLIHAFNSDTNAATAERRLLRFMDEEGFANVGARAIGNPFDDSYKDLPEIYNGPPELLRIWHERRYIRNDPTVLRALTTQMPFTWSHTDQTTAVGRRILSVASDFGIKEGVALPVHSLDQKPACVSISGDRAKELTRSELLTMGLAATHFFVVWSGFHESVDFPVDDLTPRERDVLYCAAAGLTGPETSERLGIGLASVKSHTKSIRQKLRANSMAHAVAKGILYGHISP